MSVKFWNMLQINENVCTDMLQTWTGWPPPVLGLAIAALLSELLPTSVSQAFHLGTCFLKSGIQQLMKNMRVNRNAAICSKHPALLLLFYALCFTQ